MKTSKKIIAIVVLLCLLLVTAMSIFAINMIKRYNVKKDFYIAIEENDIDTVREILAKYPLFANSTRHPIITFISREGPTALTLAIRQSSDMELIQYLVENGADVNKAPVSFSSDPQYPLLEALRFGRYDVAWYLIEQGADIHIGTKLENASNALLRGGNDAEGELEAQFELFEYMMKHKVSLEAPQMLSDEKMTYLHRAVLSGNIYIVEFLLTSSELQTELNPVDEYGETPLMFAVRKQYYDICQRLLEHGADTKIKDQDGKTAYDYALELEDQILIEMLTK